MDESYKHYVEQKKLDPEEYTLWFYLYEVQKHSNFIYDVRNQAGGYPCCEVVTRQEGGLGGLLGCQYSVWCSGLGTGYMGCAHFMKIQQGIYLTICTLLCMYALF